MLYHTYEWSHASIAPMRQYARLTMEGLKSPFNPLANTLGARVVAASAEMFVNATRRYGKPEFGIEKTLIDNVSYPIKEQIIWEKPFCQLLHFERVGYEGENRKKLLMVAPMSGHYATLLRGTVESLLPDFDIYITDWIDARVVPAAAGEFDLDDYTDYIVEMLQVLAGDGERASVMAVCQPGVPVLAATCLMSARKDPARPSSLILMGSPIDTSRNPKKPNELATEQPLSWFKNNVILTVPWPNPGFGRRVYPGFLQLSGFMSMNLDRHLSAHRQHFENLVKGDGDSAAAHQTFYDEYLAVMDLSESFYLQTIDRVFQRRLLATGAYQYRDEALAPEAVEDVALLTIEGEKDDITGLGQTEAAHDLLKNLPAKRKEHYIQKDVGHYGVFNGSRWRKFIKPRVTKFVNTHACSSN